ncbi:MAG: hypothetical protein HZB18_08040 [Chloroflexi bacterium]|nr:hypothetical protein [Chloroflexota bacterium]
MSKTTTSIKKIYFIFLAGLFFAAFNLKNVMPASASENGSAPKSDLYVDGTETPAPSSTPTATGTLTSSRYIRLYS